MLELHGVTADSDLFPEAALKRQALLFDKIRIWNLEERRIEAPTRLEPSENASLDFLLDSGFLLDAPVPLGLLNDRILKHPVWKRLKANRDLLDTIISDSEEETLSTDFAARIIASSFGGSEYDYAPICLSAFGKVLDDVRQPSTGNIQTVARVSVGQLPAPDENQAWQDILDFKAEMRDKHWHFRRWLHGLAIKQQTEAEIRDEIEWCLNEYTKAMKIHHLKASESLVDVFVITPLEIIENLIKFNWSKIARGALQVTKRKVELMEAEMKAPGRECAYVFDAWKRFGPR